VAIVIFLALALAIAFAAYGRTMLTFRGYRDVAADARKIAAGLNDSDLFRDGSDLVVAGNYSKLPTIIRFSHHEHTPGLYIRMGAPATLTMNVTPRSAEADGRVLLRTGNDLFDLRFATRTDHPNQARMLLGGNAAVEAVAQLCCSSKTYLSMAVGSLELSELVIPPWAGQHVLDHLKAMAALAGALDEMPRAHEVKIREIRPERSALGLRLAIAGGIVIAIAAVTLEIRHNSRTAVSAEAPPANDAERAPAGILPADAPFIPGVQKYRVTRGDEFDPAGAAWLRGAGQPVNARITGDFSGTGRGNDVAYVLAAADGGRRVVMLVNGESRYDADYKYVGIAARVPKSQVDRIEWVGKIPQEVDGDGLLITLKPDDTSAGLVLFSNANRIVSGVPVNYQTIRLD
jgi:hypothetical protein